MDDFFNVNLRELEKYKDCVYADNIILMSHSFINYVKEIFPVNKVPENLAVRLSFLEDRLECLKDHYDVCVELVTLEMQKMIEKGELK